MIAAVGKVMLSCENVVIYGKVAQSSSEAEKLFSFLIPCENVLAAPSVLDTASATFPVAFGHIF